MKKLSCWIFLLFFFILLLAACGSDSSDDTPDGDTPDGDSTPDGDDDTADGDTSTDGDAPADGDDVPDGDDTDGDSPCRGNDEPPYCPSNDCYVEGDPGILFEVTLGGMLMMSQPIELAMGYFHPAGREAFDPESKDVIPLDTCRLDVAPEDREPQCQSNADCAPEQTCQPEKDGDGNVIANSERCVTEVELMDVGPFTITGFKGGSKTFMYNSGQSGAYTENGQGDGSYQDSVINFGGAYEISGNGSAEHGLGTLSGTLQAPAQIQLTSPVPVMDPTFGMEFLPIDQHVDLDLAWIGSGDASNSFTINISASALDGGSGGSFTCRVADDGAFTVPVDMFTAIGLSVNTMTTFMIEQSVNAPICGEGLSYSRFTFQQTLMYFVQASE